jgi:hypothetical protein
MDWGCESLAKELLSSMEKDNYNYKHLYSSSEFSRRNFYLLLAGGIIELNQERTNNVSLAIKYLDQVEKYYKLIPGSIGFKDYLTYKYWYSVMKYRSLGVSELTESIKKDIEQIKQNNQNTSKYYRNYLRNLWNSYRYVDVEFKEYLRSEIRNLLK